MPLLHDQELADRVGRLLGEVGSLKCVAGLGFSEQDERRTQRNMRQLSRDARWRFVDLRGASAETASAALKDRLADEVVVAAALPKDAPRALLQWVRAAIDKQNAVDLGDGLRRERKLEQNLIVVLEGSRDMNGVTRELGRIPYWDFVG